TFPCKNNRMRPCCHGIVERERKLIQHGDSQRVSPLRTVDPYLRDMATEVTHSHVLEFFVRHSTYLSSSSVRFGSVRVGSVRFSQAGSATASSPCTITLRSVPPSAGRAQTSKNTVSLRR